MPSRKTSLGIALFFSLIVFSTLFWRALDQSVRPDNAGWADALGWFSLFLPLLCVAYIAVSKKRLAVFAIASTLLPGVIFSPHGGHLLGMLLGMLLVWAGLQRTQSDIRSRISIHLTKSLHLGMFLILTGFALVISGHYYYQVRLLPVEDVLSRFTPGEASGKLFADLLIRMNPQLQQIDRERLTVDDLIRAFLVNAQPRESGGMESFLSDADLLRAAGMRPDDAMAQAQLSQWKQSVGRNAEALEQAAALEEGRRRLSEALGITLTGQELVSDVLSQAASNKMRLYFAPTPDTPSSLLPFILAALLFLSLLSLGALLQWVWIGLAALFFSLAVRAGGITLKKVLVQQDVIE